MKKLICAVFASLMFVAAGYPQEPIADVEHEDTEATPQQRQQWFYGQRAYPFKVTPAGAHRRAFGEATQMRIDEEAVRANAPAGGKTNTLNPWTMIGPKPSNQGGYGVTSGRITAVAVDQTTSGASTVLYIGGAEGGIWKSSDNGSTWTAQSDSQPTLAIGSIAIDPNNHSIIYAGTGEENFSGDSYYGGGVLKSTNGGSTWTMLGASYFGGPIGSGSYYGGSFIGAIAVQPGVSSGTPIVLAGSEFSSNASSGVWRSTDGGTTWARVFPTTAQLYSHVTSVVWVSKTKAYAAVSNVFGASSVPVGVYVSSDSGATWGPANGVSGQALPDGTTTAGRFTLAVSPSTPATMYVSVSDYNTSGLYGMYFTTDSGGHWNPLKSPLNAVGTTNDFCGPQCWYDMPLAVHPTHPGTLYAGGNFNYGAGNGGVYVSLNATNGATATWSTPNPGTNSVTMHPDFHAFAFSADGNTLYIGEDGGLWRGTPTNSATMAWTDLNTNLAITEFYPGLAIYKGSKNTALNGTQDNGAQLYTGSLQWTVVTCGDGAWAAIDPTTANNLYAGCTSANFEGVIRSLDGGGSWASLGTGINNFENVAFIPPMIMDPKSSTTLYYGTDHLYKMVNSSQPSPFPTWSYVNASALTSGYLSTIAVSAVNGAYFFVGDSTGAAQFSINSGASWTAFTGLPGRFVSMVQADPHTATIAYVTVSGFSGFNGDTKGHVFKCLTTTSACTDMSGNLPNTPANDIVIDPDLANTFYVATDVGVFTSTNNGTTWSTSGTGLPNVAVVGLKLHESSRTLRAATHGRSTWDLSVPTSTVTPAAMTSPANGATMTGASATFNWSAGTGATQYSLYIGNTSGAHDIAFVSTTSLSATVNTLPTNGEKFFVSLYSYIGGKWYYNAYSYYASGTGAAATMSTPTPGTKLSSASQTFTWTKGTGINSYSLYIGTKAGLHDIDFLNTSNTSASFSNLPTNGGTFYVTLYSLNGKTWLSHPYTYVASGSGTAATMSTPTPGSTLPGASVTFNWTTGSGVTSYSLYIGTTAGAHNLDFINTTSTSASVTNLPTNGSTVYVTLYSLIGGVWHSNAYTYKAQ
ncbi:glycosyl hydrolase [Candidatus Koribacter versatilis Ellin345]|uniref:Glycosyl hydrolase n=1 Tax=Koribacter versatilis (strain Ellin345) TaxID=204669 RepID=Q1IQF1_KORVE|nr:sialidase family protein [Candidatus Koribacter versatilis]ABF40899.1 glycosyl hydrolase [Candidatus Koribacter versatilis Ellin345]